MAVDGSVLASLCRSVPEVSLALVMGSQRDRWQYETVTTATEFIMSQRCGEHLAEVTFLK